MTTNKHPSTEELVRLLSGELASSSQAAAVLSHAEACPRCQRLCETIWAETVPYGDRAASDIDHETTVVIEQRLLSHLHRDKLTMSVIDLGSKGFFYVFVGLLRPIVSVLSFMTIQPSRKE